MVQAFDADKRMDRARQRPRSPNPMCTEAHVGPELHRPSAGNQCSLLPHVQPRLDYGLSNTNAPSICITFDTEELPALD